MAITPIISVSEADVFNALSPNWLALTPEQKTAHIFNSSLYILNSWSCVDEAGDAVDWSSPPVDLKKACAYYAEADRIGVLFDPMIKEDIHGKKTMEKKKMEGFEKTIQWSMFGGIVNGDPLSSVDAIMKQYCTSLLNSNSVVRV